VGVIVERRIHKDFDLGQQSGHSPRGGGFGGAALAADQYTPNARVDSIQNQGALHAFLANDSGKWIDRWHSFLGVRALAVAAMRAAIICFALTM
jgi:hypothetical protein